MFRDVSSSWKVKIGRYPWHFRVKPRVPRESCCYTILNQQHLAFHCVLISTFLNDISISSSYQRNIPFEITLPVAIRMQYEWAKEGQIKKWISRRHSKSPVNVLQTDKCLFILEVVSQRTQSRDLSFTIL